MATTPPWRCILTVSVVGTGTVVLLLSRVGRSFEECSVASVIFEQILRKPYYVRPIGPCRVVYKVWQSWATGFVQGHQENPNNNFQQLCCLVRNSATGYHAYRNSPGVRLNPPGTRQGRLRTRLGSQLSLTSRLSGCVRRPAPAAKHIHLSTPTDDVLASHKTRFNADLNVVFRGCKRFEYFHNPCS